MRKILAPHKNQDGWMYARMRRDGEVGGVFRDLDRYFTSSRIISSRRVEEAVELYDHLKLAHAEGLTCVYLHRGGWLVYRVGAAAQESGATLREAYHRYKAVEKHEAD